MIHFSEIRFMNKKSLIIIIVVLLLLAAGGGLIYFQASGQKTKTDADTNNPEKVAITTLAPKSAEDVLWDDPAGFTFKYTEGLAVNKHDEDQDNYAHVELTSSTHPGNIIIWAKDTTASDVKAWVKTEKIFKDANILETTLGGQPAKKIIFSAPAKKVITGSIYDDLLFTVEGTYEDSTFWTNEYQKIADTFAFKPPENTTDDYSADPAPAEYSADEEETLE